MPRSGTTIIFEAFARHEALGWLSGYTERYPRWPSLNLLKPLLDNRLFSVRGDKKQYQRSWFGNHLLPGPAEAYGFWDHYTGIDFSRGYLVGQEATEKTCTNVRRAIGRVMRYQSADRFATKLTGPSRMDYLNSIFSDALFVQVIRDGRAVVHSLSRVDFWAGKGGFDRPFWGDELPADAAARWRESGNDPLVLTAVQWAHIVSTTRREGRALGPGRYAEVRYETFVENPLKEIERLYEFSGLLESQRTVRYLREGGELINMNDKYLDDMEPAAIEQMTSAMQPVLTEFGYS